MNVASMKAYTVDGNTVIVSDLMTEDQWLERYQTEKMYTFEEVQKAREEAEMDMLDTLYWRRKNRQTRKKMRTERARHIKRQARMEELKLMAVAALPVVLFLCMFLHWILS